MATKQWKEEHQEEMKLYRREHYARNKEHYKEKIKNRKNDIYKYMEEYKSSHPCVICGEVEPCCLDFHHKEPSKKDINLAQVATNGWSILKINLEISKCVSLCSNCHRKVHAGIIQLPND